MFNFAKINNSPTAGGHSETGSMTTVGVSEANTFGGVQ
jgi:hypothetical protein